MHRASQCTGCGEAAPLLGLAAGPWAPLTALRGLSGLGCFPLPNQETPVEQMEREGQPSGQSGVRGSGHPQSLQSGPST